MSQYENVVGCPGCKAGGYRSENMVKTWRTEYGLETGWCKTCGALMFKEPDVIKCVLPSVLESKLKKVD